MKRYDSYKDSGIEWIGEIPSHWEIKNLRKQPFNFEVGKRKETEEKEVISIGGEHIQNEKFSFQNMRFVSNSFFEDSKNGKIKIGDTLLVKDGATIGKAMYVSKMPYEKMLLNEHVYKIEANKFLYYVIISNPSQFQFWMNNQSSAQESITSETLKSFNFCWPEKSEQLTISAYLDKKTSEIDRMIADKEELLKLYEEEKTAVINQAVTKGINPKVKMKDSGIEWLGEIPEHWETVKLNGICNLVRGNTNFKKDELLSEGKYVALQYGKTYKVNEVNNKYQFYVNDEFYKASQIVNYGDVIFISTSETIEDLGHSVYYNRKDIGLLGGEQILLKTRMEIINGKYLYYSSITFAKELRKYATGIKVFRFNINDLKKTYIAFPPIKEQQSIVDFIESETTRIDTKIKDTQKLIELLKEYRTALISEVVTGKVKVIQD
ncbi:MAG: restriction endonuclease subunit S [Weeksellaceae bacterium]